MSKKRFLIIVGILVILAIIIRIYSNSETRVEDGYATRFYPIMASFFRLMLGWAPFSIGDILYGLVFCWLLWKTARGIITIVKKKLTRASVLNGLKKALIVMLSIYIVFNFFWGINYGRQGIAKQMGVTVDTYGYAEVKEVTTLIVHKLNTTKQYLVQNKIVYPPNAALFKKIRAAYSTTADSLPFLAYKYVSIKPSIWGWVGNYTGFTGYYNPFTGEAQINTYVPIFLQPFVACHEVAHQLGYAKENEASAVGYLAALHSGDPLLLYSTYFDLYISARRELFYLAIAKNDTAFLKEISAMLIPEVKADLKEMQAFLDRNNNAIKRFIQDGYAFYLKNNDQPRGMRSYDEVIAFLVAYHRKYKRL